MKKKKTLIVLLVLLLVGILAFTAFACKKEKPEPNDPGKEPPEKPTDKTDLGGAINGIVASLDNLIGTVGTIEDEASLSATIYVNAATTGTDDDIDLGLEITLAASMDTKTANNNWASLIVKDTVKNKNVVGLYAEATNEGEYLYIGQPLTASSFKWSKLSQAQNAGLIRDKLVPGIIDLIADIDSGTLADGVVQGSVGGFAQMLSLASALFNTNGNPDFTVDGGYEIGININQISAILPLLNNLNLDDYMSLIDIATDILLGVKLSEAGDVDFSTLVVPEIVLKVATAGDNVFTGLDISYKKALEKGNIAVSFGLKDVAFAAESKAAEQPFTGSPDELTLKLSLDVTLPTNASFAATNAVLDVYVKPAVVLGFYGKEGNARDGYFSIDFTGLDGYATLTYGDKTYTVAEYVAAGDNPGFYIDLSAVTGLTAKDTDDNITTQFYIPFDAQNMYDNWIDDVAERDIFAKAYIAGEGATLGGLAAYTIDDWKNANPKYTDDDGKVTEEDADYEKRAQEGWKAEAESIAKAHAQAQQDANLMLNLETYAWYAPAATPAPLNAAAGNEIDTVIGAVGAIIANSKDVGNIVGQIGNILGAVINDGGLLDTLTALFEDTSIFDITEVEGKEYGVVVVLSELMDNLLGGNGLIGGMLQEADGDYKPTEFELYTGKGNEKAAYTLAELMASDKVYDNIHTLINSIIYDSKLDNAIAEWKKANVKDESYADDAAYETAAYTGAVETIGTYQEFLATSAAVTAEELTSLLEMVGFAVNEDDFYAGLSLGAKVTMGDGFRAEIAVASGENVISIGLGFDIIASSDFEDLGVIGDGSVDDFQTTGGTDQDTQEPNANKLYDALKTIANAVLPEGFKIS